MTNSSRHVGQNRHNVHRRYPAGDLAGCALACVLGAARAATARTEGIGPVQRIGSGPFRPGRRGIKRR